MADSQPILVLGTGRSGTSIVAGILDELGVHLGDAWDSSDVPGNPRGVYEDTFIQRVNQGVLRGHLDFDFARDALTYYVRSKCAQYEVWGIKAPSIAQMPALYVPILPAHTVAIQCHRAWGEIRRSMHERLGDNLEHCERLIDERRRGMDQYRLFATLDVAFGELLNRPAEVVDGICDWLGWSPTSERRQAAIGIVDRHHEPLAVGGSA